MINEKIVVAPPLISGLLMTLLFAYCGTFLMWFMRKYEDSEEYDKKEWKKAFIISSYQRIPTKFLGFFEALLCFISFYSEKPQLIFAWLAFKVASKWEIWNTIIRIPEKIKSKDIDIDIVEYIGTKNRFGSNVLQRWLIGTLLNVLAGFLGYHIGQTMHENILNLTLPWYVLILSYVIGIGTVIIEIILSQWLKLSKEVFDLLTKKYKKPMKFVKFLQFLSIAIILFAAWQLRFKQSWTIIVAIIVLACNLIFEFDKERIEKRIFK